MENAVSERTPMHLWVVGGLAVLWNAFGSIDYLMTRLRNLDWLSQGGGDPQAMLAWVDSFPIWAQFGWGLGVWMGLFGSILLLMRHRWAVPVLGLSLLGAVLGLGYQIFMSPPPAPMNEGPMALLPWIIILVAALLVLYARAMNNKGVLR